MRIPFAGMGAQYPKLWAAGAVSNLGNGVTAVAGPLLAASLTRDPVLVAELSLQTIVHRCGPGEGFGFRGRTTWPSAFAAVSLFRSSGAGLRMRRASAPPCSRCRRRTAARPPRGARRRRASAQSWRRRRAGARRARRTPRRG